MTENALALIEEKSVAQYFVANGLDPIIEKIREEVISVVSDISTAKGRDEIRSRAHKVAKSKTALDDMGKKLVSGIKEQAKAIDLERSRAWDALEAIQHEVRKPLTEWEDAEKARVAEHEEWIDILEGHASFGITNPHSTEVQERIDQLGKFNRDWQEFSSRAESVTAATRKSLDDLLAARLKHEAEQAELARLRQEEADRKQREHEERLKAEAAAKAKQEAEAAAKAEAEALAAKVKAEQEKAEQERQRIEREKAQAQRQQAEAEDRAKKAEEARIAAEAKAEADRLAAAEKARLDAIAGEERAKREAEAAAQREREKIEVERKAEAEAAAKREANTKHRAKINNEALAVLVSLGLTEEAGKAVIHAIAKGEVPHVSISY